MPRSSPSWWPWVARELNRRDWTNADLARAIRAKTGRGPDESVIGRWRNRGTTPTRESVRLVAEAFGRPHRDALIAAGWLTAREFNADWTPPDEAAPSAMTDEELADKLRELAEEVQTRVTRRRVTGRPHRESDLDQCPASNGVTVSPNSAGGNSTAVATYPRQTEPAPSSPGEDERAGVADDVRASC